MRRVRQPVWVRRRRHYVAHKATAGGAIRWRGTRSTPVRRPDCRRPGPANRGRAVRPGACGKPASFEHPARGADVRRRHAERFPAPQRAKHALSAASGRCRRPGHVEPRGAPRGRAYNKAACEHRGTERRTAVTARGERFRALGPRNARLSARRAGRRQHPGHANSARAERPDTPLTCALPARSARGAEARLLRAQRFSARRTRTARPSVALGTDCCPVARTACAPHGPYSCGKPACLC